MDATVGSSLRWANTSGSASIRKTSEINIESEIEKEGIKTTELHTMPSYPGWPEDSTAPIPKTEYAPLRRDSEIEIEALQQINETLKQIGETLKKVAEDVSDLAAQLCGE